jgi:competence protein ComEC
MEVKFPRTIGATSGWMMIAFITGVAEHSVFRYWHFSTVIWTFVFLSILLALFLAKRQRVVFLSLLLLFAFSIGLWRCDVSPYPKLRRIGDKLFLSATSSKNSESDSVLVKWRSFVTARIESALPHQEAGLVAGILYGDVKFSKEQKDVFVSSGLMHIVAVSGSNVTIIVQFLSMLMLGLGLKRRHAFWLTSFAIFFYVGFVGFAASVARAAFMGWLVLFAREVGRVASTSRLLLVAATILLLINPWQLLFDIGFALSFLATWGLLAWSPIFQTWLKFLPKRFGIRETFSLTLAATIITAPYLAWAFDRLSLAGLLTNIVALPLIPFVMGWGAVTAIWGDLPLSAIVSAPAFGLASAVEIIAGLTRFVPWLDFRIDGTKLFTVFATYALIVYLWFKLSQKNDLSTAKKVV